MLVMKSVKVENLFMLTESMMVIDALGALLSKLTSYLRELYNIKDTSVHKIMIKQDFKLYSMYLAGVTYKWHANFLALIAVS